jgi:chorismate synthase
VQDNFKDKSLFDPVYVKEDILKKLSKSKFPVIDKKSAEEMKKAIIEAKSDCDSIGGIIETAIINIPAGVGDPFFDSVESTLSHLLFSVPAVKGVEFGRGFEIATMRGSSANDEYYIDENGNVKTYTNNNGGILGGITNGMPVFFRTVIKPTASILKEQNTVDIEKKENSKIIIHGRHDPCIVTRAVPVIEAVSAIAILDMMY